MSDDMSDSSEEFDRVDDANELDSLWAQLGRCTGEERAEVLDQLGGALVQRGRHGDALAVVDAARALYEELGAAVDVARSDHNAGVILAEHGRPDEARERYRRAALGYGANLRWGEAATSWRAVADLLADAGECDAALEALATAAQLHDDADEPCWPRPAGPCAPTARCCGSPGATSSWPTSPATRAAGTRPSNGSSRPGPCSTPPTWRATATAATTSCAAC
jgi:tetratricopeptide (TPR) repeat protein